MKEAENLGLSIRHRTSPPGPWRDAAARYENDYFKLAVGADHAALRPRPLGMLIPTFLGVTVVAFGLIHLIPGDPIELLAGGNRAKHRCSACSMAAFTDALIQPSG